MNRLKSKITVIFLFYLAYRNFKKHLQAEKQLRSLAARLQSVREEERTRLSRDIHDILGQELTGFKIDLTWLEKHLSPSHPQIQQEIRSMTRLIDSMVHLVRQIASDLRPGILDELGLGAALEWQIRENVEKKTGIRFRFANSLPEKTVLEKEPLTAIFRIFQEIITNIIRHARASFVSVELCQTPDSLILRVTDNGRGIKKNELSDPKSLGILGMRERALLLKGEINFQGVGGKGTRVVLTIPGLGACDD